MDRNEADAQTLRQVVAAPHRPSASPTAVSLPHRPPHWWWQPGTRRSCPNPQMQCLHRVISPERDGLSHPFSVASSNVCNHHPLATIFWLTALSVQARTADPQRRCRRTKIVTMDAALLKVPDAVARPSKPLRKSKGGFRDCVFFFCRRICVPLFQYGPGTFSEGGLRRRRRRGTLRRSPPLRGA